jgi:hypothetical protein
MAESIEKSAGKIKATQLFLQLQTAPTHIPSSFIVLAMIHSTTMYHG